MCMHTHNCIRMYYHLNWSLHLYQCLTAVKTDFRMSFWLSELWEWGSKRKSSLLQKTAKYEAILYIRGTQEPGTRPHSRRWAVGERVKLHLYLQPLPMARITTWAPPPVRSAAALDSHRSVNPTVNCTCERSRLQAPYETLMPDDLRWSWGSDASAGERLQIQIIISREVWLHGDHNKSVACRLISKLYQWDFPGGAVVKNPPANAGDMGSSPGLGRSQVLRSN